VLGVTDLLAYRRPTMVWLDLKHGFESIGTLEYQLATKMCLYVMD